MSKVRKDLAYTLKDLADLSRLPTPEEVDEICDQVLSGPLRTPEVWREVTISVVQPVGHLKQGGLDHSDLNALLLLLLREKK